MKKTFLFSMAACLAASGLLLSCSESKINDPEPVMTKAANINDTKSDAHNGRRPGADFYWVVPKESDCIDCGEPPEYISGYGGGITFGTDFQHPTTVDPTGATDGQPIVEWTFVAFQDPVATNYYTKDGAKFAVVQPKLPNPPSPEQISKYFDDLHKYWDDKTGTVPLPTWPNGPSGVIEVRGMVVRDHASPSNASVVADTYVYTAPSVVLGWLQKSGYTFTLYRNGDIQSGSVSKVTVQNSTLTASAFSLSYQMDSTGNYYRVVGTIKLSNGTTIAVDDMIDSAA